MRNVQRRDIDAPIDFERLVELWPTPPWPPLRLSDGLNPGSTGGHGPIRYTVEAHEPGRRLRFRFEPATGARGWHEFRVEDGRITHEIQARTFGRMLVLWPLAIRWLHEALIHDLFDRIERADGLTVMDVSSLAAPPHPPLAWRTALFGDPPPVVAALVGLRNRVVPFLGVRPARPDAMFTPLATSDDEVVLGGENEDFRLRVSIRVDERGVTCTTLTRPNRLRGRLYLSAIRPFHRPVMRAMLHRAARTLQNA